MSAETLRAMLKSDDVEVRRAATLACGMKDDKAHVPDLIDRLADDEEIVNITWTNDRGGQGIASGSAIWTVNGVSLQPGINILTLTVLLALS